MQCKSPEPALVISISRSHRIALTVEHGDLLLFVLLAGHPEAWIWILAREDVHSSIPTLRPRGHCKYSCVPFPAEQVVYIVSVDVRYGMGW